MRFVLSGHDLIRLVSAMEPVDTLQEAFLRVARDDRSVYAKSQSKSGDHGRRYGSPGTNAAGVRRTIHV